MKVLQVLNYFLPQKTAGTEVYTWALSKHLQGLGADVRIIIPNYHQKDSETYTYDGLVVFKYAEPSTVDRSLIMGFRKPEGLKSFASYLRNEKPDVVHFHELSGGNGITLQHVKAAKDTGAKIIMTFHLAGYTCATGNLVLQDQSLCDGKMEIGKCSSCYLETKRQTNIPFLLPLSLMMHKLGINTTRWNNKAGTALGTAFVIESLKKRFNDLIQTCDEVVVLTEWYKRVLIENEVPATKINYIPQGLTAVSDSPDPGRKQRSNKKLRLLFVGRISPLKGLHLLIEALYGLPSDKIELDIYGQEDGSGYKELWQKKTESFTNIHWKEKLSQENVVPVMREYDALCLCSTFSEMSPLVIQEAFAAKLPVIASAVYGNVEQVAHERNGLLFRYNDVGSLKRQLLRCLENPALLDDFKKNLPEQTGFEKISKSYLALYEGVGK